MRFHRLFRFTQINRAYFQAHAFRKVEISLMRKSGMTAARGHCTNLWQLLAHNLSSVRVWYTLRRLRCQTQECVWLNGKQVKEF